ncbi:UDP-N-acetylmuramoyl-tripeptide--D-alanyl-D-alanine ligase [Rhodococcus sp. BP-252]|uniref:UDP-N-acetylmuramoyl-tripeptide--D-alanyl-D- alanine ligase n=1 Tax=unclassified Rhodococcus (in: high G+C Gram-positive bacteria) TaxID=192944 RepID=UPI001C9B15DA|nr:MULTISPECIES: UDP-N-acetylmuramoyl-tripeptide--D-alanyl-D-alanine ligase [unclassified Rhodococcus (in: high G+C Gram-positive bacteria)]MBY6411355.1 UDP-N-acetylmuramoyl-tripeptide--D-alanyl-D-alanine ligase [Rhodococcus sp. BP-320]MBY6416014.1 UDP-N-acetylmuramoyl-tripeptide--D-alanyl-D-alanine ligase [Rhodococcus sp. BP-321]MBY6420477.1 UDP-N-acetylmuramoyl-tripeptide--D-alanyl-D-alanine ligase [Rhodococcus sp. BP-324]MBY6426221.1 UDP-N-acetylmuramoyl-tripeptide--D-alanyl-D-alanine ligase
MISLTLQQIADVVGGTLHDVPDPNLVVDGTVEFDSRKVTAGGLFLALPGARVDGHDHAAAAIDAGAVAVLAARPVGVPAIVVEPTPHDGRAMALEHDHDGSGAAVLAALATLARVSVMELTAKTGLTVVGVTGSSGKTSTKDLLASVLAPLGSVVAPPGSFNNELGHPWTALRADEQTKFLALELSARGVGHVASLARTAPPRIGVVLNVGTAHLGEFGSRQNIALAKGELVEALPSAADGGVAVLNADDTLVLEMQSRTRARVVTVGLSSDADIRATNVRLDADARARFTLVTADGEIDIALAVHGEHQIGNALSAAAVALECGATLEQISTALSGAAAASVRRMDVRTRADGVTVVNDSYNANPDSMRAALKALVSMSRSDDGPRRRTWAVLGEMAELGQESIIEHDAIGRLAVRLDVSRLIIVESGRSTRAMHQGAVMEGSWGEESMLVPDDASAIEVLRSEVAPGDVVLVKASQSVGLWTVADALLSDGVQQ